MVQQDSTEKAFLYGSMYSTPGIVMYYLIRKAPSFLLRLQQTTFGPKEKFIMSMPNAWGSTFSQYDELKEAVPEYFVV